MNLSYGDTRSFMAAALLSALLVFPISASADLRSFYQGAQSEPAGASPSRDSSTTSRFNRGSSDVQSGDAMSVWQDMVDNPDIMRSFGEQVFNHENRPDAIADEGIYLASIVRTSSNRISADSNQGEYDGFSSESELEAAITAGHPEALGGMCRPTASPGAGWVVNKTTITDIYMSNSGGLLGNLQFYINCDLEQTWVYQGS